VDIRTDIWTYRKKSESSTIVYEEGEQKIVFQVVGMHKVTLGPLKFVETRNQELLVATVPHYTLNS